MTYTQEDMMGKENETLAFRLPSDAYTFGDDLFNCAKESVEKSSLLPILKKELRCKIQSKRLSQGLDELEVNFEVKPSMPLTEEEQNKQNCRKENNRHSAKKCRQKKKEVEKIREEELLNLQLKNRQLKEKIQSVEAEMEFYLSKIVEHPVMNTVLTEMATTSDNVTNMLNLN